jgi:hypothetical protein
LSLPFAAQVSAPSHVLAVQLEGESVLLNLNSGCYFGLDEVGTRMWARLCQSESIQAAFDLLVSDYDVSEELLRRDLNDFINRLIEHQLVGVSRD